MTKPAKPLLRSEQEMKQDLVSLLTCSCHVSPSKVLKVARPLSAWVFGDESLKERAARLWAVRCALMTVSGGQVHIESTLTIARELLDFVNEEAGEDTAEALEAPAPASNGIAIIIDDEPAQARGR